MAIILTSIEYNSLFVVKSDNFEFVLSRPFKQDATSQGFDKIYWDVTLTPISDPNYL